LERLGLFLLGRIQAITMPKLATCIALDFARVLLLLAALRGRIFADNRLELGLLYLVGKSNVLIIILVPASIKLFITKFLLNEVIPQLGPIGELLSCQFKR